MKLLARAIGAGLQGVVRSQAERFLIHAAQFRAVNLATLDEILQLNAETDWSKRHDLCGPRARDAFEALSPTVYADYVPYIERIVAGEPQVLSGLPVEFLATTSGTTGPQKLIPITRKQIRLDTRNMLLPAGMAVRAGIMQPPRGRMLLMMTERIRGVTEQGIPQGAGTTSGLRRMGKLLNLLFTSPPDVFRVQNTAVSNYLHMLFALAAEHLWAIMSPFPTQLLFAMRDLRARAPEMVRDLADGTLTSDLDLGAKERAEIRRYLRPDVPRARALMTLLEQGQFTARKIWPDLGAVFTAGSGTFRFYVDQLQSFLGGVPVVSAMYASSEAALGIGLAQDQPGYVLIPHTAYIEFLPLAEADRPGARPVPSWEAGRGVDYEIVLTTYSGLARYRLGDVVRIVDHYGQAPIIEFVERRGQVLNVAGEKTAERHVVAAVEAACREVQAALIDYFIAPDPALASGRYLLVIEERPAQDKAQLDTQRLLREVEVMLCRMSPAYADRRRRGELLPMAAMTLKPGAFERYRAARVAGGVSVTQVKTPHVIPDPGFVGRHFQQDLHQQIELDRSRR